MSGHPLFEFALTNALLASLLAIFVWCLTRIVRNPHVAHVLWCVVLLKLVTPPVLSVPLSWPTAEASISAEAPRPVPNVARYQPLVLDDAEAVVPARQDVVEAQPAPKIDTPPPVIAPVAEPEPRVIPNPAEAEPSVYDGTLLLSWLPAAVASIWLLGSGVVALVILSRMVTFGRALRRMISVDGGLNAAAEYVAVRVGLRWTPATRLVAAPVGPLVWAGGISPLVVVPGELWRSAGTRERETLLAHEFAHLARWDHWIRRGEVLLIIVYWWLPTLWWVLRRREAAAEACCDAFVLRTFPERRGDYAEALLRSLEFSSAKSPVLLSQGLGRTSHLKARLTMIAKNHVPRRLGWSAWLILMGLAVGLLGVSAEIVQADGDEKKEAATAEESGAVHPGSAAHGSPTKETKEGEATPYAPRGGSRNSFGARGGGRGGARGPGAATAMPPMGGGYPAMSTEGMEGMKTYGGPMGGMESEMMMPGGNSNISPEVRQKMLDRLTAIALNEKEPLKVRLSAIDAASSAGLRIESVAGGEKLEEMLWTAFAKETGEDVQHRVLNTLQAMDSVPPSAGEVQRLNLLMIESLMPKEASFGNVGAADIIVQMLKNLTRSGAGLSRLVQAIESSGETVDRDEEMKGEAPEGGGLEGYGEGMMGGYGGMGMGGTPGVFAISDVVISVSNPRSNLLSVLSVATPRDDESVNVLLKALENEAADIRAAAISALGNLQGGRDVDPAAMGMPEGYEAPTERQ